MYLMCGTVGPFLNGELSLENPWKRAVPIWRGSVNMVRDLEGTPFHFTGTRNAPSPWKGRHHGVRASRVARDFSLDWSKSGAITCHGRKSKPGTWFHDSSTIPGVCCSFDYRGCNLVILGSIRPRK
jgi:hypothetical protein